jgi:hypothetical protein
MSTASTDASPAVDRLTDLLPSITRAIKGRYPYLQPADVDDAISEAHVALLSRHLSEPTFVQQTDSYIIQYAVHAAWTMIRRSHATARRRAEADAAERVPAHDPQLQSVDDLQFAATVLGQLHGRAHDIAAALLRGCNRADACREAGLSPQSFTYYKPVLASAFWAARGYRLSSR